MRAKKTKQKKVRTKRVMGNRLRRILMVFFGLCFIVSVVLLGYYVFQVQKIEVVGNQKISTQSIIDMAKIKIGDNTLALRSKKIEERISEQPYLKFKKLQIKSPSQIIIKVEERKPIVALEYASSYILIDKEGIVLESVDTPSGLLIATNLSPSAAMVRQEVQGVDKYQIKAMEEVVNALNECDTRDEFISLDVQMPTAIVLETKQGIKVRLGNLENLDKKIVWIDATLPRDIKEGKTFGTLDVSSGNGASYIPDE